MSGRDAAGISPSAACCGMMIGMLAHEPCTEHGDRCPGVIVRVTSKLFEPDLFVIPIYDGGTSGIQIRYCPWCGTALTSEMAETWASSPTTSLGRTSRS